MARLDPNTTDNHYGPIPHAGAPDGTTAVGARKGALLVDTTNAKLYINTGTDTSPTWTVVGTQS